MKYWMYYVSYDKIYIIRVASDVSNIQLMLSNFVEFMELRGVV